MDITSYATVVPIVIFCYLVGMAGKAIDKVPDKFIPVIVGVVGGILGIPAMYIMPDFPATDIITAIAVGISSGLAAVGLNQIGKQIKKDGE